MSEFFRFVFYIENPVLKLGEEIGIGVAFSVLLYFVLSQYRKMWDRFNVLQEKIIQVVEHNTAAYIELKNALYEQQKKDEFPYITN